MWILTVWLPTGLVPPSRTASTTPGSRTPTWCGSGGRRSPLQPHVSRSSWLTSSTDGSRWPPSTKSCSGPTRARHKPPAARPRQTCQRHPQQPSPSEGGLPDNSGRDFRRRLWAVMCPFWLELLNLVKKSEKKTWWEEPAPGVICRDLTPLHLRSESIVSHGRELLVTRAWCFLLYLMDFVRTGQDVVFKLVPQGL